ncbi:2-keto-4-pentenoate hydratase [Geodermatophilus sp. DSM 44513]|uniref:2-keto-4-pentenoate hydratase n=1 Tax=Geodermatophilus sp. DSM 44513 TaxID=1528104 RepID=UPI0012751CE0|nr:fumarylacetoacetate hydrolase family protein [Geodermatophilus sp. DSM 44513]WNV74118.1 fumarylacetoacetate hydrolase family protein [Geodermatophilus sp. DSM 44513]
MAESIRALAARQLADYRAGTPGTSFADPGRPRLGLDDAYRVQGEVAALRAPAERVVGYKVGCTGPGTRAQFGLDGPIRGLLFDTELHRSGSELSAAAYAELAIEGELAVRLGEDGRIATVFPVIELHNYVFRGQPPTLAELVANNGIHAGVVLPPPTAEAPWPGDEPLSGRLTVRIDGACVEEGPMDGVPGGPAGSLRWLSAHLAEHDLSLHPGQLVLTGTPLRLLRVRPGAHVEVTAEGLGGVEAVISA